MCLQINRHVKLLKHLHGLIREKIKDHSRSSEWPSVRHEYLKKQSVCEACGSIKNLQVHHVMPFHLHPELELDASNLITLCMSENDCHLLIGHGDDWKCYNPSVRSDAQEFGSHPDDRRIIVERAKSGRLKD